MIVKLKKLVPSVCEVKLIDERKKATEMKNVNMKMLPVLKDQGEEYEDCEEIEAHLEKHFTSSNWPSLKSDEKKVRDLTETKSPVSDFNKWIGLDDEVKSKRYAALLAAYFKEVNTVLGQTTGDFLDGNTLKFPDCILLPKLYHMKVVAEHITQGGDILKGYPNIQRYLDRAMKVEEFTSTIREIDFSKFKAKSNCDIKDVQGR